MQKSLVNVLFSYATCWKNISSVVLEACFGISQDLGQYFSTDRGSIDAWCLHRQICTAVFLCSASNLPPTLSVISLDIIGKNNKVNGQNENLFYEDSLQITHQF